MKWLFFQTSPRSLWTCVLVNTWILLVTGCHTLSSDPVTGDGLRLRNGKANITYALPKGLLKVVLDRTSSALTITIEEAYIADPGHLYRLDLRDSPLADDNFDVKVDPKSQLIDLITNSHVDQSGEIILKAIELGVDGLRLQSGLGIKRLHDDLPDSFHVERHVAFEEALDNAVPIHGNYALHLRRIPETAYPVSQFPNSQPEGEGVRVGKQGVIYYRVGLPYLAEVMDGGQVIHSKLVVLPNESPIQEIALKRGAFVTVSYTLDFSDGMPVQLTASRPSEILQIVSLPVKALKMISAALPYQVQQDRAMQEKAILDAQRSALEARIQYLQTLEQSQGDANSDTDA